MITSGGGQCRRRINSVSYRMFELYLEECESVGFKILTD